MIKAIELENFRAFSKRVRFEFKPITVIIGRNSSGKSSLLKWLQMARQSVQDDSEREFFIPNGNHVELGAWNDLRNKAARNKKHRFTIELQAKLREFKIDLKVERTHGKKAEVESDGRTVAYEGTPLASCVVRGDVIYQTDQAFGLQDIKMTDRDGRYLYNSSTRNLTGSGLLRPKRGPHVDLLNHMAQDVRFLEPARKVIESLKHLSALRRETRSVIDMRTPPAGDVGHEGEFVLQHLISILTTGARKAPGQLDFIMRHAREVLHVDDLRIERTGDGLVMRPEGKNMDTRASHRLSDFGFGVSQALPVFVQGAIMEEGETLAVEQPEAQLHPTAQLELGSFFGELWKKRGVGSIIETHSGNLLLRLRKLVREGYLNSDEVGVCYCRTDEGVTKVANMNVKVNGELDGNLPMEFFGADIFEALDMNAIPMDKQNGPSHEE